MKITMKSLKYSYVDFVCECFWQNLFTWIILGARAIIIVICSLVKSPYSTLSILNEVMGLSTTRNLMCGPRYRRVVVILLHTPDTRYSRYADSTGWISPFSIPTTCAVSGSRTPHGVKGWKMRRLTSWLHTQVLIYCHEWLLWTLMTVPNNHRSGQSNEVYFCFYIDIWTYIWVKIDGAMRLTST